MLEIQDLRVKKSKRTLLDVSLNIPSGQIIGLMGNNGAGKTTLLKSIAGLQPPTTGRILLMDEDSETSRPVSWDDVSFMPDTPGLDGWMKVGQMIDFMHGRLPDWPVEKVQALLLKNGIDEEKKVRELSRGMKGKLYLFLLLFQNKPLVLLDEPTLGFDIGAERQFIEEMLDLYLEKQPTIIIATNQISHIERILSHVMIIDGGKIIAYEDINTLRDTYLGEKGDDLSEIFLKLTEGVPA